MDGISTLATELVAERARGHLRSIIKAVTWRVIGSLDTLILSYVVTGNLLWAGGIASAETLTKVALFYLHERVWRRVVWGRVGPGHLRAVTKGVSWRAVGAADTFMLSWLITGQPGSAASIASLETFTKVTLYYLHEQAWMRVAWGRADPQPEVAAKVGPLELRSTGSQSPAAAAPAASGVTPVV